MIHPPREQIERALEAAQQRLAHVPDNNFESDDLTLRVLFFESWLELEAERDRYREALKRAIVLLDEYVALDDETMNPIRAELSRVGGDPE